MKLRKLLSRAYWAYRAAIVGWTLNRDVTVCSVTGLPKREFFPLVPREKKFAVVFCDLDGFKSINDLLGHLAGDLILAAFGDLVSKRIGRSTDLAFRWGGDEFAAFLRGAKLDWASAWAERVRQDFLAFLRSEKIVEELVALGVKASRAEISSVLASVDVSYGVESWEHEKALEAILRNADARMYTQKREHKLAHS